MTYSTCDFADDVERLLVSEGEALTHEELVDRLQTRLNELRILKNLRHYLLKNYDQEQWDSTTRELFAELDQLEATQRSER